MIIFSWFFCETKETYILNIYGFFIYSPKLSNCSFLSPSTYSSYDFEFSKNAYVVTLILINREFAALYIILLQYKYAFVF